MSRQSGVKPLSTVQMDHTLQLDPMIRISTSTRHNSTRWQEGAAATVHQSHVLIGASMASISDQSATHMNCSSSVRLTVPRTQMVPQTPLRLFGHRNTASLVGALMASSRKEQMVLILMGSIWMPGRA